MSGDIKRDRQVTLKVRTDDFMGDGQAILWGMESLHRGEGQVILGETYR